MTFQASLDALPLKGGLTYDDREAMPVKRAVASLRQDFLRVTGSELGESQPCVIEASSSGNEAPCLTTWVKNTFGTDYGDHRFYEKVFELILRLKGNFLWPAMWGWAFYADDPENSKVADEMGVIIGTSHHEPMARNHPDDSAILFEKIVIDAGGYQPQFLFGTESPCRRSQPF